MPDLFHCESSSPCRWADSRNTLFSREGGPPLTLHRQAVNSYFLDNVQPRVSEPPWRLFLGDGNALNYVARKGRVLLRVAPGESVDDVHAADDLAENGVFTLG